MPEKRGNDPPWHVHASGAITNELRRLQRRAAREGRGEEMLAALEHVYKRLQRDPTNFGEPLYRLPAMRMLVRTVVVLPLSVDFAICEDHPLVFIKSAVLLDKHTS
jgi:hypothetical protein